MRTRKSLFETPAPGFLRRFGSATASFAVLLCCGAAVRAQPLQAPTTDPAPAAPARAEPGAAASTPTVQVLSPLLSAVVRMADAGVSPQVIKTFVECAPSPEPLNEADVIVLKQHKVADEIVTFLLQQGAKLRAAQAQRRTEALAQVLAAHNARSGGMDPESYDYFRYYYLQPRAMAAAYERLYPYRGWRYRYNGYGPGY